MNYLIEIKAKETPEFLLKLQISTQATFLDLHNCIVENCNYDGSQMASFFTVNDAGQRLQEISLMELSSEGNEVNVAVMDVATLEEFVGKEIKTLEYQYDFFGDRFFTLNILEITEENSTSPIVVEQVGTAPEQLSLDGFEGLDLSNSAESDEMDYEKYLSSFDECKEDDLGYESLDEWDDDAFR